MTQFVKKLPFWPVNLPLRHPWLQSSNGLIRKRLDVEPYSHMSFLSSSDLTSLKALSLGQRKYPSTTLPLHRIQPYNGCPRGMVILDETHSSSVPFFGRIKMLCSGAPLGLRQIRTVTSTNLRRLIAIALYSCLRLAKPLDAGGAAGQPHHSFEARSLLSHALGLRRPQEVPLVPEQ